MGSFAELLGTARRRTGAPAFPGSQPRPLRTQSLCPLPRGWSEICRVLPTLYSNGRTVAHDSPLSPRNLHLPASQPPVYRTPTHLPAHGWDHTRSSSSCIRRSTAHLQSTRSHLQSANKPAQALPASARHLWRAGITTRTRTPPDQTLAPHVAASRRPQQSIDAIRSKNVHDAQPLPMSTSKRRPVRATGMPSGCAEP